MKRGLFYTLALVSLILQIKFSSAYIDPGTGTAIATSMWPALVGILGLVGFSLASKLALARIFFRDSTLQLRLSELLHRELLSLLLENRLGFFPRENFLSVGFLWFYLYVFLCTPILVLLAFFSIFQCVNILKCFRSLSQIFCQNKKTPFLIHKNPF